MTVSHPTETTRNGIADYVATLLNGGGELQFLTAAYGEVAICPLTNPTAFITATGGDAVANAIASDITCQPGIVAKARLVAFNADIIVECDVAVSGSDINLSSLDIALNDTIAVTDLTYSAPT